MQQGDDDAAQELRGAAFVFIVDGDVQDIVDVAHIAGKKNDFLPQLSSFSLSDWLMCRGKKGWFTRTTQAQVYAQA